MDFKNNGYLKLIIGCMFSGKTTELIREKEKWEAIKRNVLLINFNEDTRYGNDDFVYSHTKQKSSCLKLSKLGDLDEKILKNYNVIMINEGQFFSDLKRYVINWVNNLKKYVVVCGLDGDFERNPFGDMINLIPHSDEIIKTKAFCSICNDGTEAIFSLRIDQNKEQKLIGSSNYIPVCRKHYNEYNKENKKDKEIVLT